MKLQNTRISGLYIIKSKIFKDKRGYLRETFRNNLINKKNFPFDVMSFSKKKVLRGLHLQTIKPQAKIITVTYGKIYDVAVDLRKNSKTFGKYYSTYIDEKNSKSVYIPPGFAHGFQALDKENYVVYSCTKYRNKNSEISINPLDKDLKIKWPKKIKIISDKDKSAPSYSSVLKFL